MKEQERKMAEAVLFLQKWCIDHAFYFKASFHTEEILIESHRHLELWSNDVFGHAIYFLVVYWNASPIPRRSCSRFSKSKMAAAI